MERLALWLERATERSSRFWLYVAWFVVAGTRLWITISKPDDWAVSARTALGWIWGALTMIVLTDIYWQHFREGLAERRRRKRDEN